MGKLTIYLIVMSGLTLLFYFTGLLQNTGTSVLLNFLLSPENFQTSALYAKVITAIELIAAAGIVVGLFSSGDKTQVALSALTLFLLNFLFDFIAVFAIVLSANPVIAILLFSPIILMYIIVVAEWWARIP